MHWWAGIRAERAGARRGRRRHRLSGGPRGPPLAFKTVRASFPAHGSSVVGPCPGYLARLAAVGAVGRRFRSVAMRVQELTVASRVGSAAAAREAVVDFHQLLPLGEIPSTPGAAPLLPVEQGGLA